MPIQFYSKQGQNPNATAPAVQPTSPMPSPGQQQAVGQDMAKIPRSTDNTVPQVFSAPDTSPKGFLESHPWLKKGVDLAGMGAQFMKGATMNVIAKPLVSMRAGITGDFSTQDLPIVGKVSPYTTPEDTVPLVLQKMGGQKVSQEQNDLGRTRANEQLKEGLLTSGTAALETSGIPSKVLNTGLEAVKKVPGGEKLVENLAEGAGKMSEQLYTKALKPVLSKINQGFAAKAKELGVWGTQNNIIKKTAAGMTAAWDEIGTAIEANKDKLVNIDNIVAKVDKVKAQFMDAAGSIPSKTGEEIVARLDEFTKGIMKHADEAGNVTVEKLNSIKRATEAANKSIFGKRFVDLNPVQTGEKLGIGAMIDSIGEVAPDLAEANRKYHLNRLVNDVADRAAGVGARKNFLNPITWFGALTSAASSDAKVMALAGLSQLAGTTLWRTALAKGAKGVEDMLIKGAGVATDKAAQFAAPVFNVMRGLQQGQVEQRESRDSFMAQPSPTSQFEGMQGTQQSHLNPQDIEGLR